MSAAVAARPRSAGAELRDVWTLRVHFGPDEYDDTRHVGPKARVVVLSCLDDFRAERENTPPGEPVRVRRSSADYQIATLVELYDWQGKRRAAFDLSPRSPSLEDPAVGGVRGGGL